MVVFPEDVISDILSRLPVKPLFRFRCVSKPWRDLIDSPVFIKLHLNKTKKSGSHSKLIQQGSDLSIYTIDFDSITKTNIADIVAVPHPFEPIVIISCCNGLVCVSKAVGDGLAIWNPSTRRHQILPDLEIGPLPKTSNDDSGCRWVCGFGHDVLSDDYKVIVIKQTDSGFEKSFSSQVTVYSLKKNLWSQIKPFPYYLESDRSPGVVVCGALHCIVSDMKECGNRQITAFDLATEEYRIIPQPNYPPKVDVCSKLKSLGGCLSLMRLQSRAQYIDVWILKEYGKKDSWTKITRIKASTFGGSIFGFVNIIEYSVTRKELILENSSINSMMRYDIEKKLSSDIEFRGPRICYIYSYIYQESLVQLKHGGASVLGNEIVHPIKKIEKPKKRDKFLSHGFKLVL